MLALAMTLLGVLLILAFTGLMAVFSGVADWINHINEHEEEEA